MSMSKSGLVAVMLAGLVAAGGFGRVSIGTAVNAQPLSSPAGILINEVELNPKGTVGSAEWIEFYNSGSRPISMDNFQIKTTFNSVTLAIPVGTVIDAGKFYVLRVSGEKLYHSAESISLVDGSGAILDKTPPLVDVSDDSRTWQRVPDGGNDWKFKEQTIDAPNMRQTSSISSILEITGQPIEDMKCSGICMEGMGMRMAGPDALYVQVGNDTYRAGLSLTDAPVRRDKDYVAAISFVRNLCVGSEVLVDQDNSQKVKGKELFGEVYCASHNLNQELLDNKLVLIDKRQCNTSEFSKEDWATRNGC
jgi:lamin tail-like protein